MPARGFDPLEAQNRRLEREKLELERELLHRRLSVHGLVLEWLRSGAVIATLLAAIAAFWIGFGQLQQGADNQVATRLNETLSRFANPTVEARMSGVAGLQLFLGPENKALHGQVLHFMVNALSIEEDHRVRGAILDAIERLGGKGISQAVLDATLETAIRSNRRLKSQIWLRLPDRMVAAQHEALALQIPNLAPLQPRQVDVKSGWVEQLSDAGYLDFLAIPATPYGTLTTSETDIFEDSSRAITTLVRLGAVATDFAGIACYYCDFSGITFPPRANFFASVLVAPVFAHASLRGANFDSALLVGANFFAADLREAYLAHTMDPSVAVHYAPDWHIPLLECADLRGAELVGVPLLAYIRTLPDEHAPFGEEVWVPRMTRTKMDGSTRIDSLMVAATTYSSDEYYHTTRAAGQLLLSSVWPIRRAPPTVLDTLQARDARASYVREAVGQIRFAFTTGLFPQGEGTPLEVFRVLGVASQPSWLALPALAETLASLREIASSRYGSKFEAEMLPLVTQLWVDAAAPQCEDPYPPPGDLISGVQLAVDATPMELLPGGPPEGEISSGA